MEYRILGLTGVKVSVICLGTMTYGEQNTQAEASEQLDYAFSQGVNFLDTAELYAVPPRAETYGKTEEFIGNWLQQSGKRKDIVIASKIAGPAPSMTWIRRGETEMSAKQVNEAIEGSLKRLKTDYIDLYQVHWPQRPVNSFGKLGYPEQSVSGRESDEILTTLRALADIVKAGKVRYIGLSNETPWGVMTWLKHHAVHNLPRVASIQNPYSLLNRSFEVGLAEMAMQEKVGLLAYAPLGAGTISGKYLDGQKPKGTRFEIDKRPSRYQLPKAEDAIKAYHAVAKKHGLDVTQMAISFCCSRPFMTSAIIGATKMDQLKSNIAAQALKLSDDVIKDINGVQTLISNPCP